jgi:ATP-dependent DNA ligase
MLRARAVYLDAEVFAPGYAKQSQHRLRLTRGGKRGISFAVAILPIIPRIRREPFDDPSWTFELKYDGFRGLADTVNGRMAT